MQTNTGYLWRGRFTPGHTRHPVNLGGFTLIVLLAFVTILMVDVTNSDFGYFRY